MFYLGTIANVGSDVLNNTNTAVPFAIPHGTTRLFVQPSSPTQLAAIGLTGAAFAPPATDMAALISPKPAVLFDSTGVANTAFDTGNVDVTDYDYLSVAVLPSGAAAASTLSFFDVGLSGATALRAFATPATAAVKSAAWGAGESPAASGEFVGGQGGALPSIVKIGVGALGVGITARIRVVARRLFERGSILELAVPPRAIDAAFQDVVLAIRKTDAGAATCKVFGC